MCNEDCKLILSVLFVFIFICFSKSKFLKDFRKSFLWKSRVLLCFPIPTIPFNIILEDFPEPNKVFFKFQVTGGRELWPKQCFFIFCPRDNLHHEVLVYSTVDTILYVEINSSMEELMQIATKSLAITKISSVFNH